MEKNSKKQKLQSVRLSRHILPEKYSIKLKPDLESFTFTGEETIQLIIEKADTQVVLHALELDIVTAEFIAPAKSKTQKFTQGRRTIQKVVKIPSQVWTSKISYNTKAETATLVFPKALPKGKGQLKLVFRGILNDKLRGYYRSSFIHDGTQKHLATTQFEATDARRAFPCFDEPNIKAVFDVTLIVPSAHIAISNTLPVNVAEHEAGFKAVRFKPTPKMSTYLLAFVSGEFESIEKKTKGGVLVRAFTTAGKKQQVRFALDTAVRVLDFYEKYFEVRYPLPVMDLIAMPDFMANAMENWGAITFRETAILIDEAHSALSAKQWVAIVVAHEVAHQWFGNLVTMDWWTHLWLNEGFASYAEYLAVDHIYPEWNMWTQFMSLDYAIAMGKDQLHNTHPIEIEVHHPSEIDEIFDDISYRKGSSIIRMLAAYLGAEDFRKGLAHYLKLHAYKNATTDDLWIALEKVSKKPVRAIMETWTKQPGFPLVNVRFAKNSVAEVEQSKYGGSGAKGAASTLWPVPISYKTAAGKVESILLTEKKAVIEGVSSKKLNVNETGFYRTVYSAQDLLSFGKQIQKKELSIIDRWGLIHNAWALAQNGILPTEIVLQFCKFYTNETDVTVMGETLNGLVRLGSLYAKERWYKQYQQFVRSLVQPTIKRLGFEVRTGESNDDTFLRVLALIVAGANGDEASVRTALRKCAALVRDGIGAVHADIRLAVYVLTAQVGSAPEFGFFKRLYIETELPEEKQRIAQGLCSFNSPVLIRKALAFSLSKEVRSQDAWRFYDYIAQNGAGHEELWDFIKQNYSELLARYGDGGFLLGRIVKTLSVLHSKTLATDIQRFFSSHPKPGAERTVLQVLEHIELASTWKERDREAVKKFLA